MIMGKPSLLKIRCLALMLVSALLQTAKTQTVLFPDCQTDNATPSCVVGGAIINNGSVGQTQFSKSRLFFFVFHNMDTTMLPRRILKLEEALVGRSLQLRR